MAGTHEGLTNERLMHYAQHRPCSVIQGKQRAPLGKTHHKAARSIDGIDYPGQWGNSGAAAILLPDDRVFRVCTGDFGANNLFTLPIGDRDRIVATPGFVLDANPGPEMRKDRVPSQ